MVIETFYDRIIGEVLGTPPPTEELSTCSRCPMCGTTEKGALAGGIYSPETKCCTYWPILPNYQVGGVLASMFELAGREAILSLLSTPCAVPRGVGVSADYKSRFLSTPDAVFGRDVTLLCPYYSPNSGGTCNVWAHRNGACATFFCRRDRGVVSLAFWQAVGMLLRGIESSLSVWCAGALGVDSAAAHAAPPSISSETEARDGATQAALWGPWLHDKEEFYRRCASMTATLSWTELETIGGAEVRDSARKVQSAAHMLRRPWVRAPLTAAAFDIVCEDAESVTVRTYCNTDLQRVRRPLLRAIRHFRGQPVSEALAEVEAVELIRLDDALLDRLLDFRLLVSPPVPIISETTSRGRLV